MRGDTVYNIFLNMTTLPVIYIYMVHFVNAVFDNYILMSINIFDDHIHIYKLSWHHNNKYYIRLLYIYNIS